MSESTHHPRADEVFPASSYQQAGAGTPPPASANPFLSEEWVTLAEAAESLPGEVSKRTVERWARLGKDGVRLETAKVGREVRTSAGALRRFCVRVAEAAAQGEPEARQWSNRRTRRTPAQRKREIEDAKRRLREHGMEV